MPGRISLPSPTTSVPKEDLYLACAQWIADFIGEQFRPHAEEAERLFAQPQPDRAAIRELILRACRNMIKLLTRDDTVNLSKFISVSSSLPRQPTTVHEQVISPLHSHLTRLIAARPAATLAIPA